MSEKPSKNSGFEKSFTNHLTNPKTRALPLNSPLVLSREISYSPAPKLRATGLTGKTSISINVYGPSSMIEMTVDAEKLTPIVLRFLSDLDSICQVKNVISIT